VQKANGMISFIILALVIELNFIIIQILLLQLITLNICKSVRASVYNKLEWAFSCLQKATLLMGYINTKISSCNNVPTSKKLFVHIFFNFLSNLLLIASIFH